jgi:hypothetical protein
MKRSCLIAALGLSLCSSAFSHDVSQDPIPPSPGWRMGMAGSLAGVQASQDAWPTPRWPGVLGSGQLPSDRRGTHLEHATLDAAARLNDAWGAYVAWGRHGNDPIHVEAAKLSGRQDIGGDRLNMTLGRDRVPMGAVLTRAGHFDRFAQVPLVKSVILNDDWIDNGLNLNWQRGMAEGLQSVDVGLWGGHTFPGGPAGARAPALHAQSSWGEWLLDGFGAWLQPQARGTLAAASRAGHTHTVPSCLGSNLINVVCFDGTTRILGTSLAWTPHELGLSVQAAALWQHESGALYTRFGDSHYTGNTLGGWLDAQWTLRPTWSVAARLEHLAARHDLSGPGSSSVAADAAMTPNTPLQRQTAALLFEPTPQVQLSLEAGSEQGALPVNRWIGLRVVVHAPELLRSH